MPTLSMPPHKKPFTVRFAADLSDDDKRQLLTRALSDVEDENAYCYIRSVFPDYFTYEDYDNEATFKRAYTISADLSVTLGEPEEVIAQTVYQPAPGQPSKMARFSLPKTGRKSEHQNNVYPNSLLFEIRGTSESFPDKGITITSRDLADVVRNFSGATVGLEHMDTVLGDRCGTVKDLRLENGRQLFGTVLIPQVLDTLIGDGPRKVSVEFYKNAAGQMTMPRVDLVLNPRIEAAALMACAQFAQHPPPKSGKENPMSFIEKFRAFCAGHGIDPDAETAEANAAAAAAFAVNLAPPANSDTATFARLKQLETENAQFKDDAVTATKTADAKTAAAAFFSVVKDAGKVLPTEQGAIETRFVKFALAGDDLLADYKQSIEERPAAYAGLFGEAVSETGNAPEMAARFTALANAGGTTPEALAQKAKAEEEATLNCTESGRRILASRKGN